ncbi:MAG TPA: hypothetical protein VJ861_02100, partial [Treponemataceae bacterium]|nr:hypothetical protein [Treponemataceae bacterium]
MYVHGNPVSGVDPSGTTTEEKVDEGKVFPTFEEVEIKGEGGANEKNGSVNEIKNQIEDEDKILFDAWLYELINEPMDKNLYKEYVIISPLYQSQSEKEFFIQEYINVLSAAGDDTQWLEELKNIDFKTNNAHYPKYIMSDNKAVPTPRAWHDKNVINFNTC